MSLKVKTAGAFVDAGGGGTSGTEPWVRPADWLTLPEVLPNDVVFHGLVAVHNTPGNYVSLMAQGAYTVDWGDGSAPENFATGVQANHEYDYAAAALVGSESTRGYRQAVVTVTPQAGQSLTVLDLRLKHPSTSSMSSTISIWLDMVLSAPQMISLKIGDASTGTYVSHRNLERFRWVGPHSQTNVSGLFRFCTALVVVEIDQTNFTMVDSLFNTCTSLRFAPALTGAFTSGQYLFNSCESITEIPALNMTACTSAFSMFYRCKSLKVAPDIDLSMVSTMYQMFYECTSLVEVPLYNTSSATSMSGMFGKCERLKTVPLFDTSSVTNMQTMFDSCIRLQSVPLFDTSSLTAAGNMFYLCQALIEIPAMNLSLVTSASNFASGCWELRRSNVTGLTVAHSYSATKLTAAELNNIYTNLGTASGTPAITVTGAAGVTTDDPTIATAKGWTVTG
jgi:surface protein